MTERRESDGGKRGSRKSGRGGREGTPSRRRRGVEALAQRLRQQEAVARLVDYALADAPLQDLFDECVGLLAANLDVEYAKVLELLSGGESLLLRAGVGWRETLVGRTTVPAGRGSQAGFTLLSAAPVVTDDLRTETRFEATPLLAEHGVVSGLSVPIQGGDGPFGVLGAHTRERREFTEHDIDFLRTMANVLASKIKRKRAEQAARQSEERLRQTMDVMLEHQPFPDRPGGSLRS
jgi:GAF domain-containing protein